ncbi:hypothetical protein ACFRCG_07280 [Embleya sp. NPDC056575]
MTTPVTADVKVAEKSAWVSSGSSSQTHTGFVTLRNSSETPVRSP